MEFRIEEGVKFKPFTVLIEIKSLEDLETLISAIGIIEDNTKNLEELYDELVERRGKLK